MSIFKILKALRLPEITVKTGFILIGAAFALPEISINNIPLLLELFAISILSGLAIYAINAHYGYIPDQFNDRLEVLKIISKKAFAIIAIISVLVVIIWMFFKGIWLLIITSAVFLIWTVYVHPHFNLKGKVSGGIILAFIAQILHFKIGVLYVGGDLMDYSLISIYYALIFAGGHVWHELIDFEADKSAGNKTSAIYLGKYRSIWLAEFFFVLATFFWIGLGLYKNMPQFAIAAYVLAYIVQKLIFYLLKIHMDQSASRIILFRKFYLLVFMIATMVIIWPKINFQFFSL